MTTSVDDLRAKYVEMLRLRELHDLRERGDEPDPRKDMLALASRFPGALREIDELPSEELRRRIDELTAALDDASRIAAWMTAQMRYHALTRGALCAKRWLAGRKQIDARVLEEFERATRDLCWPDDAREWRADLARVAAPPRGRVTDLVFERIASELSITTSEARTLVFGEWRRKP